jgi:hypothetical protein
MNRIIFNMYNVLNNVCFIIAKNLIIFHVISVSAKLWSTPSCMFYDELV